MRLCYRFIFIALLSTLVSGCFSFASKEPEATATSHFYIIDVDRGAVASSFAKNRVVRINPVRIVPQFRSEDIIFRVGENEYQPQAMQEFITDPQQMLTSQLRRWLEKSGLFSRVVTDNSVHADLILDTAVTAFYGDNREKYSPKSVLEMQFFLSSTAADSSKIVFQTGYRIEADLDKTTPTNVVSGLKNGLTTILTTLEKDMSGYFSKVGAK